MKLDTEVKIIMISSVFFIILLILAIAISDIALSTNLIFLGILILVVPYSLYKFFELKRIREYEREFPAFLRDLAESQRAGLSILQAIRLAAKSDYGSLSSEVRKMSTKLSWNVPLEEVLQGFANRMRKSSAIVRSMMVIEQANKSGGSVEDTMDSLATNIEMIRDVQEEKNVMLNQQVFMMYAIFFIFVGITIALIKFLIPLSQTPTTDTFGFIKGVGANPCSECVQSSSPACVSCTVFFSVSAAFGFGSKDEAGAYYKALFFIMIIVQGLFSGLIAGQISSDSVTGGVKHSFLMLSIGVSVFLILIKTGIV